MQGPVIALYVIGPRLYMIVVLMKTCCLFQSGTKHKMQDPFRLLFFLNVIAELSLCSCANITLKLDVIIVSVKFF